MTNLSKIIEARNKAFINDTTSNTLLAITKEVNTVIQNVDGKSFTYKGEWNSTTAYEEYDVVKYNGSVYLCINNIDKPTGSSNYINIANAAIWDYYSVPEVKTNSVIVGNASNSWGSIISKTPIQNNWNTLTFEFELSRINGSSFGDEFFVGLSDYAQSAYISPLGDGWPWSSGISSNIQYLDWYPYGYLNTGIVKDSNNSGYSFSENQSFSDAIRDTLSNGNFHSYKIVWTKDTFNDTATLTQGSIEFYYKLNSIGDWILVATIPSYGTVSGEEVIQGFKNTGISYPAFAVRDGIAWTITELQNVTISIDGGGIGNLNPSASSDWEIFVSKGDDGANGADGTLIGDFDGGSATTVYGGIDPINGGVA